MHANPVFSRTANSLTGTNDRYLIAFASQSLQQVLLCTEKQRQIALLQETLR